MVRVRDVGRVIDGFEDSDTRGRFNGKPAADLIVYKTGDQDAIEIATSVKAFVAGKRGEAPPSDWMSWLGVKTDALRIYQQSRNDPYTAASGDVRDGARTLHLELHSDLSRYITDRLDMLKRNGAWGLLFVFLALLAALNWRVAFWVMMGLVLSICGGIVLMSLLGATLNLISMFGLIVVLGLIVDDAIVVGENVYARVEAGEDPRLAAVRGTEEVTWPVVIAVATTIGAFFPLMFIEGRIGDFMGVLPIVVMSALGISLVEALMILPCHLADTLKPVRRDLEDVRYGARTLQDGREEARPVAALAGPASASHPREAAVPAANGSGGLLRALPAKGGPIPVRDGGGGGRGTADLTGAGGRRTRGIRLHAEHGL